MSKPTCFIIMPLTTPTNCLDQYKGDTAHFYHVLDHLFKPAIEAAGLDPIPPISKGSEVIHGDIIKNIETADLVLCDMSILNPNVFFELGIRTALNKSVAMVKDDATPKIPFDTGIINHHTYKADGLTAWAVDDEIESLKTHFENCMKNGSDNALWGYFSMSQQAKVPEDAPELEQQMGYLIKQVESLRGQVSTPDKITTPGLKVILFDQLMYDLNLVLNLHKVNRSGFRYHHSGNNLVIETPIELPSHAKEDVIGCCKAHDFTLELRVIAV